MSQETEPAAQARLSKLLGGEVTRQMVREWRRKGYPLEDGEEVVGAVYYNLRKPIWFDQAYKARLQHWRLIQALLKNQDPQQPGEGT